MADNAEAEEHATLKYPGGELELDIVHATEGAGRHRSGFAAGQDRLHHLRRRIRQHGVHQERDHLYRRRRRASCATAATRSSSWPRSRLHRGQLPADLRRTADDGAAGEVHHPDPAAHAAARGSQAVLRRLPAQRAPDGGAVQRGRTRCRRYYQDSLDPFDDAQVELSTIRLLAKLPTIAAYAYKKSVGQPFLYPDNSLTLVENFLRMMFGFPAEPYEVDPEIVRALDLLLILHADHEQNCSTSTVRLVGSSQANLFASISGGINALWGPLHGGANQAVLEMLEQDPRRRRRRREIRQEGQGPRGRREADGLRPPRLQELRSRGRASSRSRPTRSSASSASTTRCSTSPRSWRRSR